MQHGLSFSVNPARFTLTLRVYPLGTLGDHRRGSTVVRSRLTECWLGSEVKTLTFVVTLFNNQNRQPDSRDFKHPDSTKREREQMRDRAKRLVEKFLGEDGSFDYVAALKGFLFSWDVDESHSPMEDTIDLTPPEWIGTDEFYQFSWDGKVYLVLTAAGEESKQIGRLSTSMRGETLAKAIADLVKSYHDSGAWLPTL